MEREVSVVKGISVYTFRKDRHLGHGLPYPKIKKRKIV